MLLFTKLLWACEPSSIRFLTLYYLRNCLEEVPVIYKIAMGLRLFYPGLWNQKTTLRLRISLSLPTIQHLNLFLLIPSILQGVRRSFGSWHSTIDRSTNSWIEVILPDTSRGKSSLISNRSKVIEGVEASSRNNEACSRREDTTVAARNPQIILFPLLFTKLLWDWELFGVLLVSTPCYYLRNNSWIVDKELCLVLLTELLWDWDYDISCLIPLLLTELPRDWDYFTNGEPEVIFLFPILLQDCYGIDSPKSYKE